MRADAPAPTALAPLEGSRTHVSSMEITNCWPSLQVQNCECIGLGASSDQKPAVATDIVRVATGRYGRQHVLFAERTH